MDPRIETLLALIQDHRRVLGRAVEAVPAEMRNAKPAAGGWSVAEVLEHLAATERAVTELLSQFRANSEQRDEGMPFDEAAFERDIDMPFFLDRSQKIRGPQPTGVLTATEAWAALTDSRETLLGELERAQGLALEQHSRAHPASGGPLDAYQWVAFVGLHEGRHASQIEEIRSTLSAESPDQS